MTTRTPEAGTQEESRLMFDRISALVSEFEAVATYAFVDDPRSMTAIERHDLLRTALAMLNDLAIDPSQERTQVEALVERMRSCAPLLGTGKENDVSASYELDQILANTQRNAIITILGSEQYQRATGIRLQAA